MSLEQLTIARREVLANDIEIEILYCGVSHSDLHTARNDWGGTQVPAVPGHEIRHWKVGKGNKVAVVGLVGLEHMAIKLAKGLAAEVILFV